MTQTPETRPVVTVTDDPEEHVFRATLDDGAVAGGAFYDRLPGSVVIFTHTEVYPEYEGKGVGTQLARGALEHVREAGGRVVPLCPFIRGFMARHPEYDDLLKTYTDLGTRAAGPGAPAAPEPAPES